MAITHKHGALRDSTSHFGDVSKQDRTTINYRGAHDVPVKVVKKMIHSGKHKGDEELKTLKQVGKRPKGSIDYRKPSNVTSS